MSITVGTIVKLKVDCLGNRKDTLGVCYYQYDTGSQIIFANGAYDGFSALHDDILMDSEQHKFLEIVGYSDQIAAYNFRSVLQVSEDFKKGHFDNAIKKSIEI